MICVEKAPIVEAIDSLEDILRMIRAIPMKNRRYIMDMLRKTIDSLPEIDPDTASYEAPRTEMVEEIVPMVPYGKIGSTGFFCQSCKTRVKQKDRFCRNCGCEFRKEDDDGKGADGKAAV